MKSTKDNLNLIYRDIINNELTLEEIADRYGISVSTVYRINGGKTYTQSGYDYPLRKGHVSTQNTYVKGFVSKYREKYNPTQLAIILYDVIDYNTIYRYYNQPDGVRYIYNKEWEKRRTIYDIIVSPHQELVQSDQHYKLTQPDKRTYSYFKLMSKLNGKENSEKYIYLYKDIIIEEMKGWGIKILIENEKDLQKYIEWTQKITAGHHNERYIDLPIETITMLYNIYYNFFNDFSYLDFNINDFSLWLTEEEIKIAAKMIASLNEKKSDE